MKKVRGNYNSKDRSFRRPKGKTHHCYKWLMPYGLYLDKQLIEVEDPITGTKTGHIFVHPDYPDLRFSKG